MQKIRPAAAKIFAQLLQKLGTEDYIKLHAAGVLPLVIEKVDYEIATPWGVATDISLCHYYELNGDLLRDIEMCFYVVDERACKNDPDALHIYPFYFRNDNVGLEKWAVSIRKGEAIDFNEHFQFELTVFANSWMKTIQQHGFLR